MKHFKLISLLLGGALLIFSNSSCSTTQQGSSSAGSSASESSRSFLSRKKEDRKETRKDFWDRDANVVAFASPREGSGPGSIWQTRIDPGQEPPTLRPPNVTFSGLTVSQNGTQFETTVNSVIKEASGSLNANFLQAIGFRARVSGHTAKNLIESVEPIDTEIHSLHSLSEISHALIRGWFEIPGKPRAFPQATMEFNLNNIDYNSSTLFVTTRTYVANSMRYNLTEDGASASEVAIGYTSVFGADGKGKVYRKDATTLEVTSPMAVAQEYAQLLSVTPAPPPYDQAQSLLRNNPNAEYTLTWYYPLRGQKETHKVRPASLLKLAETQSSKPVTAAVYDNNAPVQIEKAPIAGLTTEASWRPLLSGESLRPGEKVRLRLRLSEPRYVYLVNIDSNQLLTPLYPYLETPNTPRRQVAPDQALPAGVYLFPDNDAESGYQFTPGQSDTTERFLFILSRKQIPDYLDKIKLAQSASLPSEIQNRYWASRGSGVRGVSGIDTNSERDEILANAFDSAEEIEAVVYRP